MPEGLWNTSDTGLGEACCGMSAKVVHILASLLILDIETPKNVCVEGKSVPHSLLMGFGITGNFGQPVNTTQKPDLSSPRKLQSLGTQ